MTNRYVSFEDTVAAYTTDTFTFTANQHDIDAVTEEFTPERNHAYPKTSKGRVPRAKLIGPLAWTGSIEALLYTQGTPSLLYYAMGANTTVVDMPTLGVQQHTVTPAETIPDFILGIGRDVMEHDYTGCVATGYSIDFAPADPVSVSVDVNARKEQAHASLQTITFPDYDSAERTFSGVEVAVAMGVAEGGTPTANIITESSNITYENNFEDSAYILGDQHLSGNFVNAQETSGSLEFSFSALTDYDFVTADTDRELEFTTTQGSGAAERGYVITLPRISYDNTSIPTTDAERYLQTIDFTATPNAAGDNISIVFTNDELEAEFIA